MSDEKSDESKSKVTVDLGFGNLFKGLGDFVDLLGSVADLGEEVIQKQGEFQVKGLGERGRGIYGFTVRSNLAGTPTVERFGNIKHTDGGPVVADVREPLVDVFDEADEVVIVAELPGVSDAEIGVSIVDDILSIETQGARRYAKEILLDPEVDTASLRRSYNNGILELHLSKAKG
jgi:HSP20 family protein